MKFILPLTLFSFFLLSCKMDCKNADIKAKAKLLNNFMDNWHHAAAIADENAFFGCMDTNSVYLGTDPEERWLKHEFMAWGMKYFQRDTAWAFTPYNRYWEFSKDGSYAWFDELLKTHMGICRGSGVLVKYKYGWKIKHYNLALTLPNNKIKGFRKLVFDKNQ